MRTKDSVIEMIRQMPDDATVSEIIDALAVRRKIDEGLRQLDAGEGIAHQEAVRRLRRRLG